MYWNFVAIDGVIKNQLHYAYPLLSFLQYVFLIHYICPSITMSLSHSFSSLDTGI
jgi:hypothetical protein